MAFPSTAGGRSPRGNIRYGSFRQCPEVTQMPRFSSPSEPGQAPALSSYPRIGAKPLFPAVRDRYGHASNAKKPTHMLLTTTGGASFTVVLPDEQATMRLMVDVASAAVGVTVMVLPTLATPAE